VQVVFGSPRRARQKRAWRAFYVAREANAAVSKGESEEAVNRKKRAMEKAYRAINARIQRAQTNPEFRLSELDLHIALPEKRRQLNGENFEGLDKELYAAKPGMARMAAKAQAEVAGGGEAADGGAEQVPLPHHHHCGQILGRLVCRVGDARLTCVGRRGPPKQRVPSSRAGASSLSTCCRPRTWRRSARQREAATRCPRQQSRDSNCGLGSRRLKSSAKANDITKMIKTNFKVYWLCLNYPRAAFFQELPDKEIEETTTPTLVSAGAWGAS